MAAVEGLPQLPETRLLQAVHASYRDQGGGLEARLAERLSDVQYLECSFTIPLRLLARLCRRVLLV